MHAADTPDAGALTSRLSLKVTVLGIYLNVQATDAVDCHQAQLDIEDVVLIMHRALATDKQPLGITNAQAMSAELTLAAVSLNLHGPGTFPVNLHILNN